MTQWLLRWSPVLCDAFDWIRALPPNPALGITELRGNKMYVNVHGYDTLPTGKCKWESHRHTIDLQYCISGGEIIEWLHDVRLEPDGEYNAAKDTQKWSGMTTACAQLHMFPGAYAIFLPNELHRPKICDGVNANVLKLVVKIDAKLLDGGGGRR